MSMSRTLSDVARGAGQSDKIRFSRQWPDETPARPAGHLPSMHPLTSLPRLGRPKSRRLVARISVRLRREGGSLSMTVPRYIVRHWNLEPGARLVVRSTDEGVLLYPRYFAPYVDPGWLPDDPDDEPDDDPDDEPDHEPEDSTDDGDAAEPAPGAVSGEEAAPTSAR